MTKNEAADLIAIAGGASAFGRFLGIEGRPNFQQVINNWKNRGIPPQVELEHYEKIQELRGRLAARSAKKPRSNPSRDAATA